MINVVFVVFPAIPKLQGLAQSTPAEQSGRGRWRQAQSSKARGFDHQTMKLWGTSQDSGRGHPTVTTMIQDEGYPTCGDLRAE